METGNAIEIRGLGKRFGSRVGVDDLTFDVKAGEVFGFMGHNGAGKTTTLRMLLGLIRPTTGSASVLGHDVVKEALAVRRTSGFLPGEFALPKELTARQFLRYIGAMFGASGPAFEARIVELLGLFELGPVADLKLGAFSSGMAQKVGLAQALVNRPTVLLLDEPTTGLDPLGRHNLLNLIRRLSEEGTTVLFSTHVLSDVEAVCKRVAILHEGRLIACGDLEELKRRHGVDRMDDLYLKLAIGAK